MRRRGLPSSGFVGGDSTDTGESATGALICVTDGELSGLRVAGCAVADGCKSVALLRAATAKGTMSCFWSCMTTGSIPPAGSIVMLVSEDCGEKTSCVRVCCRSANTCAVSDTVSNCARLSAFCCVACSYESSSIERRNALISSFASAPCNPNRLI